jgi:AcrR family transcriptional regulator
VALSLGSRASWRLLIVVPEEIPVPPRPRTAQPARPRAPRQSRANDQARRDEIVQIAGRLFAERGFLATTIRDIADAADILSGSLYHHFASKESIAEELLSAYWNDLLSEYERVADAALPPRETVRGYIEASIMMFQSHEFAVRMVLNDWSFLATTLPIMEESLDTVQKYWVDALRKGLKDGSFDDSFEPRLAYRTIMGSISATGRWYRPGGRVTTRQLAQQISDLFLRGLESESASA